MKLTVKYNLWLKLDGREEQQLGRRWEVKETKGA